MYGRDFEDPDGNLFSVFWMDPVAAEQGPAAAAAPPAGGAPGPAGPRGRGRAARARALRCGSVDGMAHTNDPEVVRRLLTTPGRWAVVGLSANTRRVAYGIAAYLQGIGMEIVPVHPHADAVHGAQGFAALADIPGPVDVVDVFVRSDLAGAVVDEAIATGARAVWLQLGVVDEAAVARAAAAGLDVVMDTCPAIEGPRIGLGAVAPDTGDRQ